MDLTMGDDPNEKAAAAAVTSAVNEESGNAENPSLMMMSDGPPSLNLAVGPPSPLTGCYLLIVIGEPYSQDHKDIILQKLLKGKLQFLVNHATSVKTADVNELPSFPTFVSNAYQKTKERAFYKL